MTTKVFKGDICYQKNSTNFTTVKSGFLVVRDGKILCVTQNLPDYLHHGEYEFFDYTDKLIVPGISDTHLHASQNAFRGMGMDLELIDWLNKHAFSEEAKFSDNFYAEKAYDIFADELKKSATTRACVFATVHKEATVILMNALEKSGLKCFVGKVNMDRNSPSSIEEDTEKSLQDTVYVVEKAKEFKNVRAILTPRFTPSCSPKLLFGLSEIQKKYDLPVQSHLSENLSETALVASLHPETEFYAQTYDNYGLFGKSKDGKAIKTVMAHCVWSCDREIELMKNNGVFIAHSPLSNLNLSSGIAPVRKYLDRGLKVTLASDVAGGNTKSMFSVIVSAVQVSKMYWRLVDNACKPITFSEAFYMATATSGEFFGKVGKFEEGYDADILVLDDSVLPSAIDFSIEERLERFAYLNGDLKTGGIKSKFVCGEKIF